MYLKTFEKCVLKYMNLTLAWHAPLKTTKVKLDFLAADIGMLLMIEKGIRGGICHAIHRLAKTTKKYSKNMIKIKNCHT